MFRDALYIRLGGRKVDVLIKNPLKPMLPIHEQALRNRANQKLVTL